MSEKSLIPEVCKLLGVSVNEIFDVEPKPKDYNIYGDLDDVNDPIYIDKNGGIRNSSTNELFTVFSLMSLLKGDYKIIKLSYKPIKGDVYFYSVTSEITGELLVSCSFWKDNPSDFAMLKSGWVYRTREEAEAALSKIKEEMKVFIGED